MKVLMLNGSAKLNGNTFHALQEAGKIFTEEGIEWEIFQLGAAAVRDCTGCGKCGENGKFCIFDDDGVNEFIEKAKTADGFIFGTPVYYAHPSGRILSFLDRVFYSGAKVFKFKPGASISIARRGGTTASFDVINKYFGISCMPLVPSTYWSIAHGRTPGEVTQDGEGMQTVRNLARNMAWMLCCIEAGKNNGIELPKLERGNVTNFIR